MISHHKDAMICDLAEVYHIYDYRGVPVQLLATLVAGLRADSRTKMEINGTKVPTNTLIMAMIYDRLSQWIWAHTRDGKAGRNAPRSVTEALTDEPKPPAVSSFEDGDAFDLAYRNITGGTI